MLITNGGDALLTVTSTTITGSDASSFAVVGDPTFTVAPGGMQELSVAFAPLSANEFFASLDISHDGNNESSPFSLPLDGLADNAAVTLDFGDGVVPPGGEIEIEISVELLAPVFFLEFTVEPLVNGPPTSLLTFDGGSSLDFVALGFDVEIFEDDGEVAVSLFDEGQLGTPATGLPLIGLSFDVDPSLPSGTLIEFAVNNKQAGEIELGTVPVGVTAGEAGVGIAGDIRADGSVNILYVITAVKYAIGQLPTAAGLQLYLADINQDETVNVLDVVQIVNEILGIAPPPDKLTVTGTDIVVRFADVEITDDGQVYLPLYISDDRNISGLQVVLDGAGPSFGIPSVVTARESNRLESRASAGELTFLVYDQNGEDLRSGTEMEIRIPVRDLEDGHQITLKDIIVAGHGGRTLPVRVESSTIRLAALPTDFALVPAFPNPFNPSTTIAYDVPRQAHITLKVYNVLGQEVSRLVDDVKSPGSYKVQWSGLNRAGQEVASGVYLYRLESSTGFSDVQRMMLLK